MYPGAALAVGALFSAVSGMPLQQDQQKRAIEWITKWDDVYVTVPVTTTIWVTADGDAVTTSRHLHGHHRSQSSVETSSVLSANTVLSAPSVPTSAAVVTPAVATPASSTTETPVVNTPAPTTSTTSTTNPLAATAAPTVAAPPTSSTVQAVAATQAPDTSSSSGSTSGLTSGLAAAGTSFTDGELTWYQTGLGACGITSSPSDAIVAVSYITFDSYPDGGNPNNNPICGKQVTITGADGSPYTATIVDRCTGCEEDHLDLSQDFFNTVTNNANGVMNGVSWKYD